jgi:hypothetical protein
MTKPLYIIRMYSCFMHLLLIFHNLLMNVHAFENYAIEFFAESLQVHYNHLQIDLCGFFTCLLIPTRDLALKDVIMGNVTSLRSHTDPLLILDRNTNTPTRDPDKCKCGSSSAFSQFLVAIYTNRSWNDMNTSKGAYAYLRSSVYISACVTTPFAYVSFKGTHALHNRLALGINTRIWLKFLARNK